MRIADFPKVFMKIFWSFSRLSSNGYPNIPFMVPVKVGRSLGKKLVNFHRTIANVFHRILFRIFGLINSMGDFDAANFQVKQQFSATRS